MTDEKDNLSYLNRDHEGKEKEDEKAYNERRQNQAREQELVDMGINSDKLPSENLEDSDFPKLEEEENTIPDPEAEERQGQERAIPFQGKSNNQQNSNRENKG